MTKRIKILFIVFSFATSAFAQRYSYSPYSHYGIGTMINANATERSIMGGAYAYADSTHINLQNPASIGSLRYTSFVLGASMSFNQMTSQNEKVKNANTTFDYIALALPIYKNIGLAVGIMPYTSVGYRIRSKKEILSQIETTNFDGKGGINKAFLSLGYQPIKGLNIGASVSFTFGKVQQNSARFRTKEQYSLAEESESIIRGVSYNFAASYTNKITEDISVYSTIIYAPMVQINSKNSRVITTSEVLSNGSIAQRLRKELDFADSNLGTTKISLPTEITAGLGFGEDRKWLAEFGFVYRNNREIRNDFYKMPDQVMEPSYTYSLGGFFIPKYNSFTSYWKRVTYMAGVTYEDTGLIIENNKIRKIGASFGVALPLRGFSDFNIGVEYATLGTNKNNLIKENYWKLKIGITFNDKWFQRAKYQ